MSIKLRSYVVLAVLLLAPAGAQYIERVLNVGRGPRALAYDSTRGRLFVACGGANAVKVVSVADLRVTSTMSVGQNPTDIVFNPAAGKVYVCCSPVSGGGSVYVIDAESLRVLATLAVGTDPYKLVLNTSDNTVCCLNRTGQSVSIISCDQNRVLGSVSLPQVPDDIIWHPTNNRVYTASGGYMQSGKVTVIDPASRQVVKTLNSGREAYRLASNPVQNRVYCGNKGSSDMVIIDGSQNNIVATVSTASEPWAMLYMPLGKLYVGNYWTATASVMRGSENQFFRTFGVAGGTTAFAYDAETRHLYAASALGSRVSVIDARDGYDETIDSIITGAGPSDIAVCQEVHRVFVGNAWDSTVTVIRDMPGGVGEAERGELRSGRGGATVCRGVLSLLPTAAGPGSETFLLDPSGRRVASLHLGPNDVSHLEPGVYFVSGRPNRSTWSSARIGRTAGRVVLTH
jgi:YVTN family beta-propeller protein